MARHTEEQIADLMRKFSEESEREAVNESGRQQANAGRRRTAIMPESTMLGREGEYRVSTPVAGYQVLAESYGDAVLESLDMATREAVASYGAHIFLWQFEVDGEDGIKVGSAREMRDELERARLAQAERNAADWWARNHMPECKRGCNGKHA